MYMPRRDYWLFHTAAWVNGFGICYFLTNAASMTPPLAAYLMFAGAVLFAVGFVLSWCHLMKTKDPYYRLVQLRWTARGIVMVSTYAFIYSVTKGNAVLATLTLLTAAILAAISFVNHPNFPQKPDKRKARCK